MHKSDATADAKKLQVEVEEETGCRGNSAAKTTITEAATIALNERQPRASGAPINVGFR